MATDYQRPVNNVFRTLLVILGILALVAAVCLTFIAAQRRAEAKVYKEALRKEEELITKRRYAALDAGRYILRTHKQEGHPMSRMDTFHEVRIYWWDDERADGTKIGWRDEPVHRYEKPEEKQ